MFFATLALSVYLFVVIPKGFFPQQDNGLITSTSEASQDISFAAMQSRQEELSKIVMQDPAVATRMAELGLDTPTVEEMKPAAFAAFQKAELGRWKPILEGAGVKAE